MNIIGCLDRASEGTYLFEEEDISEMNDDALSDLRLNKIGFVFQSFNLVPVLTVRENIVLPIQLDGGKVDERYVGEVVTALGLEKKLNPCLGDQTGHSPGRRTDRKLGQPYQPRCTEPDEGDGPEIFPNDGHDYTQRRNCPTL